jgi:hypothetical protein
MVMRTVAKRFIRGGIVFCFLVIPLYAQNSGAVQAADQTTLKKTAQDTARPAVVQPAPAVAPKAYSAPNQPVYRQASSTPPPVYRPAETMAPGAYQAPPAPTVDDYLTGKLQGEQAAIEQELWLLAGLPGCCYGIGGLGMIAAYAFAPEPPMMALMGKSTNYILGYTEGFKDKSRWKNVKWAGIGCAIGSVIEIVLYVVLVVASSGSSSSSTY